MEEHAGKLKAHTGAAAPDGAAVADITTAYETAVSLGYPKEF